MSGSSRRILAVAVVLVGATVLVLLGLARLMLGQHDLWHERSLRNRWAFRDVPSRRGAILDRNGVLLVDDHPRFALEFDAIAFARSHPVGAAVVAARRLWPDDFASARPEVAPEACRRLLSSPVAALRDAASDRPTASAVRAGVRAMVAGLTERSAAELARDLSRAVREPDGRTVAEVLHIEVEALVAALRGRLRELDELALLLRNEGGERDLFAVMAARLLRHLAAPEQVVVPVALIEQLRFATAAELACARERWAGLHLRPAVHRERWFADATPSLQSVLGFVSAVGRVDSRFAEHEKRQVEKLVAHALGELDAEDLLPDDIDASDAARERMGERLEAFVLNRIYASGRLGRSGVEAAANETLQGSLGLRVVERDAKAREQALHRSLDVSPGHDVHLTVDLRMQTWAEQVVATHAEDKVTALVVIDAQTGAVLALAGQPLDRDNPAKAEPGEPPPPARVKLIPPFSSWHSAGDIGSLAKPFVLLEYLAAQRAGAVRPYAEFDPCARLYDKMPGTNRHFSCDGYHNQRGRDPAYALAESCNIFFFQAAKGLGRAGLIRAYERAGFSRSGEAELAPLFQDSVPGLGGWAMPRLAIERVPNLLFGIGYGVHANALSVARAYAALATGAMPRLHLTLTPIRDGESHASVPLGAPAEDLDLVREGLRLCPLEGTTRSVRGLAQLGVWGKTGTAEVTKKQGGEAGGLNNAWFAGFVMAPTGRATLAFAAVRYVVPEHGKESAEMVVEFLEGLQGLEGGDALHRRWLLDEVGG